MEHCKSNTPLLSFLSVLAINRSEDLQDNDDDDGRNVIIGLVSHMNVSSMSGCHVTKHII